MKFQKLLITGGTSGIGEAIVNHPIFKGCEIHIVARNFSKLDDNPKIFYHSVDLSNCNSVSEFADNFIKEIGVPDIIINNAGAGAFYEWSNFPLHEIHRQINLLYVSPILICRKFAPPMKKLNKGIIANISSLAILYPVPFMPIYNSTKSALSSFTQSMILEFIDYPKFMDFRLGDVFTNFNKNLSKQPKISTNNKLNSAWKQIDLQLVESPTAKRVSENILKNIIKNKSGVFYGGGFFQSKIAPLCSRFFSQNGLIFLLRRRYFK